MQLGKLFLSSLSSGLYLLSLLSARSYSHTCFPGFLVLLFISKPIKTHQHQCPCCMLTIGFDLQSSICQQGVCAWLTPHFLSHLLESSGFPRTSLGECSPWHSPTAGARVLRTCDSLSSLEINKFSKLSSCLSSKPFKNMLRIFYMKCNIFSTV